MDLRDEISKLLKKYPTLSRNQEKNCIEGYIEIENSKSGKLGEYKINLLIPKNFPKTYPKLYEVGGKILKTPERHINYDGSCCVGVEIIMKKKYPNGLSLVEYFENEIIPFFYNQIYYDYYGEWANGDYAHYNLGILEAYYDLLKIEDKKIVITCLEKLTSEKSKMNRNEKCFCGSNLKIKKCHLKEYEELKAIRDKKIFFRDLEIIKKLDI